jgi:hypothetical protein
VKIGVYIDNYTVLIGIRGNILENVFNWKFRFHGSEVSSFASFNSSPSTTTQPSVPQSVLECVSNNDAGK